MTGSEPSPIVVQGNCVGAGNGDPAPCATKGKVKEKNRYALTLRTVGTSQVYPRRPGARPVNKGNLPSGDRIRQVRTMLVHYKLAEEAQ
jgi:hypothetical protein